MEKEQKKRGPKPDLKTMISDFVKDQLYNLDLEKKEEENEILSRISNYSAKQLEQLGVCIRKLKIEEITYSSYGKYLTEFKKNQKMIFQIKYQNINLIMAMLSVYFHMVIK